jgi:hypothetical protein
MKVELITRSINYSSTSSKPKRGGGRGGGGAIAQIVPAAQLLMWRGCFY